MGASGPLQGNTELKIPLSREIRRNLGLNNINDVLNCNEILTLK
uniref:Uncharacterized protein n=1 Tax=Lepeophtheirus salmonis TaxID=72036 RepID=A0A0K2VEC8_LEPSM